MERIEELVREELLRNGEFAPTLRRWTGICAPAA